MADLILSSSFSAGGISTSGTVTRDCATQIGHDPDLPAGQEGSLTTRTDADTGVVTLDASATPTVISGDRVTLFWTGGYRYNVSVTNVTGSAISVDGGSGDNLPDADTDIIVGKEIVVDTDFDGDNVLVFSVSCQGGNRCHFRFDELVGTDSTPILAHDLPAGEVASWNSDGIFANPLVGVNVGAIVMSNGGTTDNVGQVAIGVDSVA